MLPETAQRRVHSLQQSSIQTSSPSTVISDTVRNDAKWFSDMELLCKSTSDIFNYMEITTECMYMWVVTQKERLVSSWCMNSMCILSPYLPFKFLKIVSLAELKMEWGHAWPCIPVCWAWGTVRFEPKGANYLVLRKCLYLLFEFAHSLNFWDNVYRGKYSLSCRSFPGGISK